MASQLHNLAVKLTDLPLDGISRFEQRSDRSYQLRTARDQLVGSHGEDIELGTADHQAEVFEKAANMVLEIALDLDQQRPAGQQRPERVAVDILDVKACRKYQFGGHFLAATGAGATAGATGVPSSNPGPA